jgi:ABC-type transport system involved in multi-copper enzyme maturation permease subunit
MMPVLTIARLTIHETARKRLLLALVLITIVVALLTGWLFHKILELPCTGEGGHSACITLTAAAILMMLSFMFSFVLALGAAFIAAPSISADIESGILLSMLTRPVRRSDVLLGKWLGLATLVTVYGTVTAVMEFIIMKVAVGYVPPNPTGAIIFLVGEALVVLTLAMLFSTRLSAITGGIIALVLFGASWLGGITGQIGAAFHNQAIENVGTISSLILPTDGLWRGAIYNLEPVALIAIQDAAGREASANPFFVTTAPATPYILWSVLWVAGVFAAAVWSFARRDL